MTDPFIIYALPRSRTNWLTAFLNVEGVTCYHDIASYGMSVREIKQVLSQPGSGTVETGATPFWRPVQKIFPNARRVVVLRNIDDVTASCHKLGLTMDRTFFEPAAIELVKLAHQPGVMAVTFDQLNDEAICSNLFKFCTGMDIPEGRWEAFKDRNIQSDVKKEFARIRSMLPQIEAMKAELNGMITYQVESWNEFYPDCIPCLLEHRDEIGELDIPFDPDLDQIRAMDQGGGLQIITARNGSGILGYCIFVIGRNLTSKNTIIAEQKLFFLKKSARTGLSIIAFKLYMMSIELLKMRGVHTVYPHHWMSGDSPKIAKLFERLGAVELERVYSLKIGG